MKYGKYPTELEEEDNALLERMTVAEKVAKGSIILGVILTVISFLLFQPLLFVISWAFYIAGIPLYLIYRAIRRKLAAQIAKEKRRAEIAAEQHPNL